MSKGKPLSIVVSLEDYDFLKERADRVHSYPATIARGLLTEKIAELRAEVSNGGSD